MDDLISEFITETTESLQTLDSELVKLEQNPNDSGILSHIFRLVHTIKGTCGFLGLPRLEAIAHASENVLGKVRDKVITVSPAGVSLVLESLDCIKTIVDYLGRNGEEPAGDDTPLIGRLNLFAETGIIGSPSAMVPSNIVEYTVTRTAATAPEIAIADITRKAKETAIAEGLATYAKDRDQADGSSAGGQTQSIRVNLDVLDNLMQMVGELVLTRNQLMQMVRTHNDHHFSGALQHLSHITTALQEGVMKTRMQPIGNAWSTFPRLIRDLAHELNKKIDLRMVGAETELDRQLIEMIKDPLTHMVRNSADHGIEIPAERKAAGKPETGTITISAFHEGGHIIIEISDDGRGLNLVRIKEKAIANGLTTGEELSTLSDAQIMQFIFRAGFSTAEKITSVSGRGVGMDVVRANIEKIGGTVELSSVYGKGCTFLIKIPLTLAIVSVLIVEARGERFALPQINVQELVRVGGESHYRVEHISNALVLRLRDKLLPLISLPRVLEMSTQETPEDIATVIVCQTGGYSFGLIVDRVFDTEEIVVKPCSHILRHIPLYSGSTILGDGNVIMILDPNGLARATGEHEIACRKDVLSDLRLPGPLQNRINFLLFESGKGAPKAVPLELVWRLEEIDLAKVEHSSGGHPVIQYRDSLMHLCTLPGVALPETGTRKALVFTYDGQTLGLVVDVILDIVSAEYDIKISSLEKSMLGSMIIAGRTTDVIDVAYLLRSVIGEYPKEFSLAHTSVKRTLLLIDDSPFFRALTVPFLSKAGYHVTAADHATEALRILEHTSFDVIVSDIEMPGMDGFAFAEACRNNPHLATIPLFAFTSTIDEKRIERGQRAGFKALIDKTNRIALLQAIADVLAAETETA